MSWSMLFGSGRNQENGSINGNNNAIAIPGVTPIQQQRSKQIESLNNINSNVSEEIWDKEYKVRFTAAEITCFLTIFLPAGFPNVRPMVKLFPHARHPWLDEQMNVVGCSSLNTFYMHSNLGKVVRQIIEEFKKNLQHNDIADQHDVGARKFQACRPDQSTMYESVNGEMNGRTPIARLISTVSAEETGECPVKKPPSDCSSIEELMEVFRTMQTKDAETFVQSDDKILEFITNMDLIKDLKLQRKSLIENNAVLAEQNLNYKPQIEEIGNILEDNQVKFERLQSEFQSKLSKQDELSQVFNINQIITNLRISISQTEELTENIAEDFLEKKIPLDEFLPKFLQQRKLLHLRKGKEERIRCQNPQ